MTTTSTEKKYSKNLGKLIWYPVRKWVHEPAPGHQYGGRWENLYLLGFIARVYRTGWRNKGPFAYAVQILEAVPEDVNVYTRDGMVNTGAARFEVIPAAKDLSNRPK